MEREHQRKLFPYAKLATALHATPPSFLIEKKKLFQQLCLFLAILCRREHHFIISPPASILYRIKRTGIENESSDALFIFTDIHFFPNVNFHIEELIILELKLRISKQSRVYLNTHPT